MTKYFPWMTATALAVALMLPVSAGADEQKPGAPAAAPKAAPAAPAPHIAAPPPHVSAPAPHVSAPAIPHVSVPHSAAVPHFAPHQAAAPHVAAPRRAAIPHVTPHRQVERHVVSHAAPPKAASSSSAAAQTQSSAVQRRAESRNEERLLRSLPPKERAAKREEFRKQREHAQSKTQAQPSAAVQSSAAAQTTTAAQRRADRAERRREERVLRSLPPKQRAAKREEFRKQREQRLNAQNAAAAQASVSANASARARRRNARRNGGTALTVQAARQGRFAARLARRQAATSGAAAAAAADPAHRAWHRHPHRAAFVAWYGPVFWPYAYSDIFDYAFWPYGYDEGYWDYAYDDFFDSLFWGEAGPPEEYAYAPPVITPAGNVTYAAAQELCNEPGSGVTAWPFGEIESKVNLDARQKSLLDDMRAAATKAAAVFKASCPSHEAFPLTPPGRLTAMTARLSATLQAVETVRPALEDFYNSLSDEQKERFNALGPSTQVAKAGAETTGSTTNSAESCKQPKPGLDNLPIDTIEDVVKPNDAQEGKLDTLQTATSKAVAIMAAACPDETPLTPTGRLDVMQKRLQAMIEAANEVKPALADFYSSLSNEQKARFDRIGRELAKSND